ncbi:glycosyltransferase family 4 protein [Planctomycetota bacterium]|nr:glycosyltransferase family 4 protein [Planctomycetota bacterium]
MRICLFTPNFYPAVGGAEKAALTIAQRLHDRGHEVTVLGGKQRARDRKTGVPDFDFRFVQYTRPPKQNVFAEGLAWPLIKAHKKYHFDVVLAFYAYPTGYAANIARKMTGVPVVISPRGGDLYPNFHGLKKLRVKGIVKKGYGEADRIVAMSNWLIERIEEICGENHPTIDQVYNGIDLKEHDQQLAMCDDAAVEGVEAGKYVLMLARLAEVKRQETMIDAAVKLKGWLKERGIKIVMAGDGANRARLEKLVDEKKVRSVVMFTGTVGGLEKYWLLKNARLLVSTSREEGMPNTLIEAIATGLPVLASDIGPHVEMVDGKGFGELFKLDDIDELAKRMKGMIDGDMAGYQAKAKQEREVYSVARMIDGYEKALEAVLKQKD